MSANFLQNLIAANLPTLAAFAANGEFRVLAMRDAVQTDEQGFPSSDFIPRMQIFIPCAWTARRADEREDGAVVRGMDFYEITGAVQTPSGNLTVESADQIELRLKPGDTGTKILEAVAVVRQGLTSLKIWAIEVQG